MSPLFLEIFDEKKSVFQMRVCYGPEKDPEETTAVLDESGNPIPPMLPLEARPGRRLSLTLDKVSANEGTKVASVEEAENILFSMADGSQVYDSSMVWTSGEVQEGDRETALSILICRASNIIACRTRRGGGNVVFAHPDTIKIMERASTSSFEPDNESKTIGRWKFEGTINQIINVYSSETMARDELIVAYVGNSTDAPGTLFQTEDGYAFLPVKHIKEALGNAQDYLQRISIVH